MVIKYPCLSTVIWRRGKRSGGFIWFVGNCGASLLPANLKHKALASSALCCVKITHVLGQTAGLEQCLVSACCSSSGRRSEFHVCREAHMFNFFLYSFTPAHSNPPQIILFATSFPPQQLWNHLLWLVMALSISQLWPGYNNTIIILGFVLSRSWILFLFFNYHRFTAQTSSNISFYFKSASLTLDHMNPI